MSFLDDFCTLTEQERKKLKKTVYYQHITSATKTIEEYFKQQDRVELNIAVTGESGSGKSTFVNAFRGLGDDDKDSAENGVVETTMEPKPYHHPKYQNVKLWDLPGIGTPNFRANEYLKQVQFERYDFFIIIASERFRECHARLAKEIMRMEKKFYFVRSKIDQDMNNERRKRNFEQKRILDKIRENCINGLKGIDGLGDPVVFLISSYELSKYDFNLLQEQMENELPLHKRHMLNLSLSNITLEVNEKKKEALKENMMATYEEDFCIRTRKDQELIHVYSSICTQDLPSAINTIKDYLKQQEHVVLNFAVTGESGSGKSTFVNAFRGLGDEDEGAAITSVVETTMDPEVFLHPKYKNVKVWDLPGIGTPNFKASEYLRQVQFERYDFFIIIASDQFKECHTQLAKEIMRMGKKFHLLCLNMKRKNSFDKDKPDFSSELPTIGIEAPVILIPYHQLGKYDFNVLMQRIKKDHQQHKRHKLMKALSNITLEINERKKKTLEKKIPRVALLSAGVAAIPGLSIAADVAIIADELKKYYRTFGLDDPSLQKLCERSGKTVKQLKSLMKSPLYNGINPSSILVLLSAESLLVAEDAVEFFFSLIPIVGSVVVGGLSYLTVSNMLKRALNDIAEDARKVLMAALESDV